MKIDDIGNILGAKTIEKIYDDALSSATKESGKILSDIVKSFRLFTLPFQIAASWQERLQKYFEDIRQQVPENRQIESPAMISGPIIERLKYLEEGNHLTYLFLSLLARSIDSERINEAHPSFIYIIDQLSPDEATILSELKHNEFKFSETLDLDVKKNWWDNRQIVDNHFPVNKLAFPQNFSMYYDHLYSLSLIDLQVINEEILIQNEILVRKKGNRNLITSDFGKLFIKACVP